MSGAEYNAQFLVTLSALTALCALKVREGFSPVSIQKFPFRIGRAALNERSGYSSRNDLELFDGEPFQVSRKHCLIERKGDSFYVRDNGSSLGTIVNGTAIGVMHSSLSALLTSGKNTIILGAGRSPFKFLIEISEEV